ncbi:MAG: DNA-directed RNA polymerase subunit omega [Eubacterium sp.]|nr:DNA-directed RNA polymerase subunit omega [Eubacterium sp.]
MLHPSYTELLEKINSEEIRGEEPAINSRYSIVIASAKRARELISGKEPIDESMEGDKPLSIAVQELFDGEIHILPDDDPRFDDEIDFEGDLPEDTEDELI